MYSHSLFIYKMHTYFLFPCVKLYSKSSFEKLCISIVENCVEKKKNYTFSNKNQNFSDLWFRTYFKIAYVKVDHFIMHQYQLTILTISLSCNGKNYVCMCRYIFIIRLICIYSLQQRWVTILSAECPTMAFHASITNPFGKGALINLLRQFGKVGSNFFLFL